MVAPALSCCFYFCLEMAVVMRRFLFQLSEERRKMLKVFVNKIRVDFPLR